MPSARLAAVNKISIHALRAEGDLLYSLISPSSSVFLSTPSVRRATVDSGSFCGEDRISIHALRAEGDVPVSCQATNTTDFYPRPPCGGRRGIRALFRQQIPISIHALRAEGDFLTLQEILAEAEFLSTPSVRRATCTTSCVTVRLPEFLSTPSVRRATQVAP